MRNIFLSVIIPCYNEENNLKRDVLSPIYKYLSRQEYSWEIVISNDGSTDQSMELIEEKTKNWKNIKILNNVHGGKPHALMQGIKNARGKYLLFTDMDQSTPITELGKLIPFVKKGYKAIIGSRGLSRKNFPLYRKLGALIFATIRKTFILSGINDTQCGFKLFEKNIVGNAFPKLEFFRKSRNITGWTVTSYDVELLHIIEKSGVKIKEIKVAWRDTDTSRSKGGILQRYLKESKEMLFQIMRVELNDIKGMY